ncbi:hypothetical protein RAS1_29420 [Phycisphaerae bacterium RAS1]|nr:hypothetical protein RAS1_29420 [Phycisphaerae bacterium RAS1]
MQENGTEANWGEGAGLRYRGSFMPRCSSDFLHFSLSP